MKILLINNFHYRKGGSETVYFNTAEILQKRGHEVIFFSRENPKICRADKLNILFVVVSLPHIYDGC